MNNKGFINILIIIAVLAVLAGAGYYVATKKAEVPQETQQPTSTAPVSAPIAITSPTAADQSVKPLSLPTTCKDAPQGTEGVPVITSISPTSGPAGTKVEIKGCNFSGFEGDKNVWIENNKGEKAILRGEAGSTGNILKLTLKSPLCEKDTSYSGATCDVWLTLKPGVYKIYAMPWGKKSNEASFTVK